MNDLVAGVNPESNGFTVTSAGDDFFVLDPGAVTKNLVTRGFFPALPGTVTDVLAVPAAQSTTAGSPGSTLLEVKVQVDAFAIWAVSDTGPPDI